MATHLGEVMKFSRENNYDPSDKHVWVVRYIPYADSYKIQKKLICGDAQTLAYELYKDANDKLVTSHNDYGILTYTDGEIGEDRLSADYLMELKIWLEEFRDA